MKKVFPSQQTQNFHSVPIFEGSHKAENATVYKLQQSTVSKQGPLSIVPSEANQSYYQIIEKHKVYYLEQNKHYNEMHFMESMTGLKPRALKIQLLEQFMMMHDEMIQCLQIIQNTLIQINFNAADFQVQYEIPAANMMDILYKDIETLKGLHSEMLYSSPLRYMDTVMEALNLSLEYAERLNQFDIKAWSAKCTDHLMQFKSVQIKPNKISFLCC